MEKSAFLQYNFGKPKFIMQVTRAQDPKYNLIESKTRISRKSCGYKK